MDQTIMTVLLLVACTTAPVTPKADPPGPAAPAPGPRDPEPLPAALSAAYAAQGMWGVPERAWHVDFDGNGSLDWVVAWRQRVGFLAEGASVERTVSGWAPDEPRLEMAANGRALTSAGTAGRDIVWDASRAALVQHQALPPGLASAVDTAVARFPAAFREGIPVRTANDVLTGDAVLSCADAPIVTVGDFDGDGQVELVVVEADLAAGSSQIHRFSGAALTTAAVPFPGCRAYAVAKPNGAIRVMEDEPLVATGDLIDLLVPEKASVLAAFNGGEWNVYPTSE